MKKKVLIGCICLSSLIYANEPSVYGAGNIDSANPYGLSKTEQSVLDNRRTIQNLKNRVAEQQNRIDGLITIIDGLNKKVLALKEETRANATKVRENSDNNKTYSLLLELGNMVDQINNNYVTREDLKEALAGSRTVQRDTVSSPKQGNSADISTTYRRGVQLFGQKSYNASKEKFEEALSQNYKLASSNYYLGEIAYYTKNYPQAIRYYKKSASLYNSASYMPILYLHTAIALARDGQKEQARNFFQFVVDSYPNTKAANIAKKNL
ncbi:MAG TPA: tetratricopeptide repeat protein [Campylobacterales bacterium]|jgi:TolA-binding protein|nr:tetratricopeptide repeat protein [Campylobacterales bacterium]